MQIHEVPKHNQYEIEVKGVPVHIIRRYISDHIPDIPGDSKIEIVGDHRGVDGAGGIIRVPTVSNCSAGNFEENHAVAVKKIIDICLLLERIVKKGGIDLS